MYTILLLLTHLVYLIYTFRQTSPVEAVISDFSAQLSRLHERHAEDLQLLVESYRKKHSDLRNERPPCASQVFQAWETLLQEVEVDSQLHSDVAGTFVRQVSRPLIEKTFHRKLQSKKLFAHRESIETILGKTEEMLKKELEEVHLDVNGIVMDSILQGADVLAVKAKSSTGGNDALSATCRNSDPRTDVVTFVKHFDNSFLRAQRHPPTQEIPSFNPLRNELVLDRLAALSSRTRAESLKREATDLEKQIAQLQEGMDALIRAQQSRLMYYLLNQHC
ncbi:hypothetical protein Avbf_07353 [Armadillidium vulgare]|nr:hypothetical protein Avbf_07353 [Armadillidium vulgare]